MKLVIAGSRDLVITREFLISCILEAYPGSSYTVEEIVSGGASGVDAAAKRVCFSGRKELDLFSQRVNGKYKEFPADWDKHGKAAGPIRNREMANYGDALLLVWDGKSRGSANMKLEMQRLGKPIFEVILRSNQ